MTMRRSMILVVAVCALAFPAPAAAADGTVEVGKLYKFTPATITINQGDTVTWKWVGPDTNDIVRSDPGQAESFDSHPGVVTHNDPTEPPPGGTFSHTFTKVGTFTYFCFHHPLLMKGAVVVLPSTDSPSSPTSPSTALDSPIGPVAPGQSEQGRKQSAALGRATLRRATSGCVNHSLSASVKGSGVRKVVFKIDGRRVRTVWKANGQGRYSLRADVARLRSGVHDLTTRTTFSKASNAKPETDTLTFVRCARRTARPKFTG